MGMLKCHMRHLKLTCTWQECQHRQGKRHKNLFSVCVPWMRRYKMEFKIWCKAILCVLWMKLKMDFWNGQNNLITMLNESILSQQLSHITCSSLHWMFYLVSRMCLNLQKQLFYLKALFLQLGGIYNTTCNTHAQAKPCNCRHFIWHSIIDT